MAEMTAEQAAEWGKTLDFPTVWAALLNLGEKFDQREVEFDKRDKALSEKIDKTTENVDKLTEDVKKVTSAVGGLHNSIGGIVETLFAPHLGEKFEAYNYNLKRVFGNVPIYDETNQQKGEIDILLSNTTVCMAVEVKRWLKKKDDVDEHIVRMGLIRKYPPAETKGKKLLGAIAGAVVVPEMREYAEKKGFFVLELTGEDVQLLEPTGFEPREW